MEKSITVLVMGREYTLRVAEKDETMTREIAAYVDDKMTAFRKAFPKQPEMTSAVIAALAIAEELYVARDRQSRDSTGIDHEIDELSKILEDALPRR